MEKHVKKAIDLIVAKFGVGTANNVTGKAALGCGVKEWISTGASLIDEEVIGRPGIPVGKLTTIYGAPYAGKSTMGFYLLKETQALKGIAVLIDAESSFTPDRATSLGLNSENLVIMQPDHVEDTFAKIKALLIQFPKQLMTIVWDSTSSTPTKAEVGADDDASRGEMASHARIFSFHLRRITTILKDTRCALVFVAQKKSKVGVVWGSPETFLAEATIRFHSHLVLKIAKVSTLPSKEGIVIKIINKKSRVGPPLGECKLELLNDTGYNVSGVELKTAVAKGIVSVYGKGWYLLGEKKFRKKEFAEIQLTAEYKAAYVTIMGGPAFGSLIDPVTLDPSILDKANNTKQEGEDVFNDSTESEAGIT